MVNSISQKVNYEFKKSKNCSGGSDNLLPYMRMADFVRFTDAHGCRRQRYGNIRAGKLHATGICNIRGKKEI